jgi:nitroreductase
MDLNEIMNWRYAVKKYTTQKVPASKVEEILEAIRMTASSAGIQPYKVLVIENEELRKKLQEFSFNPQVSESSHLLVFAAYDQVTGQHVDDYMQLVMQTRGVTSESLEAFRTKLKGHLVTMSSEAVINWAGRQAFIALGTAMIAAAELKVDSTPMEGFSAEQFDEVLGLKQQGLRSVALLALGYRDTENDIMARQKKVRMPLEQMVARM